MTHNKYQVIRKNAAIIVQANDSIVLLNDNIKGIRRQRIERGKAMVNETITSTTATTVINNTEHVCTIPGCGKAANMTCPTCLKLGIPPSRFCSQDCFKSYWETHKTLHKEVKKARGKNIDPSSIPYEFEGFSFSGPLRPFQKTAKRTVPDHIPKPDYALDPMGYSQSEIEARRSISAIKVYTPSEISSMREVCRLGREVLDIVGHAIRVGITTDELDVIAHEAIVARDAYPSPLHYRRFPKSICTSINEVICHGIPDLRPLEDGDIINIDVSLYKNGYHTDLNETFLVGIVDETSRRLVKASFDSLAAAIAICRPGTLYRYDLSLLPPILS